MTTEMFIILGAAYLLSLPGFIILIIYLLYALYKEPPCKESILTHKFDNKLICENCKKHMKDVD